MRYLLTIENSSADGATRTDVAAQGKLEFGGLKLLYSFDGADYTLVINKDRLVHERHGEVGLKMEFIEGNTTCAQLSGLCGEGFFSVYTKSLSVEFTENGCKINCVFSDGSGEKSMKITAASTS